LDGTARSGKLKFSEDTLVVAFIDPTGISQVPMNAMLQLTKNKRIDLLVTIQHSLVSREICPNI
jgi:hypothetical protein